MIHRFVFPKGRIILVDWIILFLFFEQKRRRNEEEVFIEAKNLSRKTKEIMIDDRIESRYLLNRSMLLLRCLGGSI